MAPPAFLTKERIVAPPGFNRWRIPPVSVAIHLCIGSVYSWSIFNPALTRELGVVTSAAGSLSRWVVVGTADVSAMIAPESAGVYVVGTGGTGAAQTFFTLGIIYFLIMLTAFFFRVPAQGWQPDGWNPERAHRTPFAGAADSSEARGLRQRVVAWLARVTRRRLRITREEVHVNQAHKTPQFYLLWIILCFNVTAD